MLTLDLLRTRIEGGRIEPRYVDVGSDRHLGVAQDLIDLVGAGIGGTRRQLQEAVDDYAGDRVDYRIQRGLTKLLIDDRCEFEVRAAATPVDLRRCVFAAARRHHPVVGSPDLFSGDRQTVLAEAAVELGLSPTEVDAGLYADLADNHVLTGVRALKPRTLLQRYNVALAQAMLYRCSELRLVVGRRQPARVRQLFGAVKLNRLIHVVDRQGEGFRLRLDGPVSLLRHSQRYGVRMAAFLPALLPCRDFHLQADVPDGPGASGTHRFELDPSAGLVSHRRSWASYDSKVEAAFARRFEQLDSPWRLERETELVDLGEAVMIPDFAFRHADGRVRLLEIVGYWRPQYLRRKMERLRAAGRADLLVAVSERLNVTRDDVAGLPGPVLWFKGRLDPKSVLAALDAS